MAKKKNEVVEHFSWDDSTRMGQDLMEALVQSRRFAKSLHEAIVDLEYGRDDGMAPDELEVYVAALKLAVRRSSKLADDLAAEIQKAKAEQVMAFCT